MAVLNASPAVVFEGLRGVSLRRPPVLAPGPMALVIALMGAFLVALALSMTVGRAGTAPQVRPATVPALAESAAYPAWTVEPGDTLWTIAQRVRPRADPRAVVLEIQVLNQRAAGDPLQAGDVLQLPRG